MGIVPYPKLTEPPRDAKKLFLTPFPSKKFFLTPFRFQDTRGENATFDAGISFQALRPGLIIRNEGTASDAITFQGAPGAESLFLFYGDVDTYTRIRIKDGVVRLRGGGEMVIH